MANGAKAPSPSGYDVGYAKPPARTRFKKGQSGNPKGRPKGALNMAAILARTLREPVLINENAQRKTVTKLEAAMKQLVNKSAAGDLGALRQLTVLVQLAEQRSQEGIPTTQRLDDADEKVVRGVLKRFEGILMEGQGK
jgi:hypothetical protein